MNTVRRCGSTTILPPPSGSTRKPAASYRRTAGWATSEWYAPGPERTARKLLPERRSRHCALAISRDRLGRLQNPSPGGLLLSEQVVRGEMHRSCGATPAWRAGPFSLLYCRHHHGAGCGWGGAGGSSSAAGRGSAPPDGTSDGTLGRRAARATRRAVRRAWSAGGLPRRASPPPP